MARRLLTPLLLVPLLMAGCVAPESLDPQTAAATDVLLTGEPLWSHAPTAPHPAFGYPTFTHLPADAPAWWEPIPARDVPLDVSAIQHVATLNDEVEHSGGIAVFGRLLITTGWTLGGTPPPSRVFDITDPANPVLLSELDTRVVARDVDTIAYPDGRLVAVFASDNGVMPVWDVTDPRRPRELTVIQVETVSHNVGIVPGTPIVYNANSQGSRTNVGAIPYPGGIPQGVTEIYDLTDPENPELVEVWENGYGCHAITFHVTPERQRAYCAGAEVTQIWDVADPRMPEVVTTIPAFDPDLPSTGYMPARFSHLALASRDGNTLIVGDESFEGLAPGCDAYTPPRDQGPLGNLYFYDISDETNPVLEGQVSPSAYFASNPPPQDGPVKVAGCTAHFGSLMPHPEKELLAMAFYGAGVVIVDFTDREAPEIVTQWNPNTNTWDVWYYNGWLFTGDLSRGADVLRLE